ncbi:MAG: hypothetical protein EXX96DRAFT_605548 [Benjaminiella poitrasii]|nr:MAG: hypothetical protein EXX96DRAFT_605548 [Benjaminiella poitrasii]
MDIFILKLIYAELIYDQERNHCVKTKTTGLRISSHVFLDVSSTYIVYPPYNGIILVLTCLVMLNQVLLRIHLAPNRYKAYLDFVESKQKEILAGKDKTKKALSKNQKRNILRHQEYKKRQCLEKIQKIRSESAATEEWSFRQKIQAKRKGKQRMSHVE